MKKTWWQKELFTLEELLLELQQAKKDSEHFWSFAAHQLQHPLAVLQEKLMKVADKSLQKTLERQVYELRRQVTIMLQYQQWKRSGISLKLTFGDLGEFVKSIMDDYQNVQTHEVKLVRLANKGIFGFVDEIRLGFALKTLIENALNHTPSGSQIWMGVKDKHEDEYEILIGDTGQGMAKDVLEGVFAPYKKQAGSSGHGLGAALAKVVIENHGGSIKAESAVGLGTKFSIVMPKTPKKGQTAEKT